MAKRSHYCIMIFLTLELHIPYNHFTILHFLLYLLLPHLPPHWSPDHWMLDLSGARYGYDMIDPRLADLWYGDGLWLVYTKHCQGLRGPSINRISTPCHGFCSLWLLYTMISFCFYLSWPDPSFYWTITLPLLSWFPLAFPYFMSPLSGPLCHLVHSLQTERYSTEDTLYQILTPEGKLYPSL